MGNWKSLAVMKGDGTTAQTAAHQSGSSFSSVPASTSAGLAASNGGPLQPASTRYYKLGSVTKPSQAAMLH